MSAASHGTTPYYFVPGPSSFEVGGKTPAAPKTAALGHGVLTGNAPS